MIFKESLLKVADNSGARIVRCIQSSTQPLREGDFLVVSVRKARPGKKAQKGKVYRALLVQCRKPSVRSFGHSIGFRSNRVVLLKKSEGKRGEVVPLGSRISKTVSFSVRKAGLTKILLISPGQL
jgi:large subunit ribosomal protein L14